MTTEWFISDSQETRADEWTRIEVYASSAEAIARAAAEIPHQMRIGQKAYNEPAVWGPRSDSTRISGLRFVFEAVGKPFRAFAASTLENWLRTASGDMRLQIRIGNVTGAEAIGYSGRGTIAYTFSSTTRVVETVGGGAAALAGGIGGLAQGLGETAQGTGDFLSGAGKYLVPLLLIAALMLVLIALVTAPTWLPKMLGNQ